MGAQGDAREVGGRRARAGDRVRGPSRAIARAADAATPRRRGRSSAPPARLVFALHPRPLALARGRRYGLRVYQNESNLLMHVDKVEDHVISSIFHVDHAYDDDAEPWPIVIEAFDGTTHEVRQRGADGLVACARLSARGARSLRGRALGASGGSRGGRSSTPISEAPKLTLAGRSR